MRPAHAFLPLTMLRGSKHQQWSLRKISLNKLSSHFFLTWAQRCYFTFIVLWVLWTWFIYIMRASFSSFSRKPHATNFCLHSPKAKLSCSFTASKISQRAECLFINCIMHSTTIAACKGKAKNLIECLNQAMGRWSRTWAPSWLHTAGWSLAWAPTLAASASKSNKSWG